MRLRDIGGLIVIDFIDVESKSHNKEVERILKDGPEAGQGEERRHVPREVRAGRRSAAADGDLLRSTILLNRCDLCGGTWRHPDARTPPSGGMRRLARTSSRRRGGEAGKEVVPWWRLLGALEDAAQPEAGRHQPA